MEDAGNSCESLKDSISDDIFLLAIVYPILKPGSPKVFDIDLKIIKFEFFVTSLPALWVSNPW